VVVDGGILAGDHGDFGAIGHFIVVNEGRPCFCGARGCLESYASGHALRQAVRALRASGSAHAAFPDLDDPDLPGRVFALAAAGDPPCRGIVEEAIPLMAYAFASLIRLTDIDRVTLLGAYVEGGEWLRARLHERIALRLPEVMRSRLSIRIGARLSAQDILAAAALPAIRAHLGVEQHSSSR
jgi:predicted NBD/HSP70 family sugar kinase